MATTGSTTSHPRPAPDAMTLPAHLHPISFIARLEWRLANAAPKQKGQRTRERLKLACAQLLERGGFHNLRASDVAAEAGLAEGSFYLYFTDKRDVTRAVLGEFQDMYFGLQGAAAGQVAGSAFEAIRFSNQVWVAYARTNAGLLRCLYQFADEDPAFAAATQKQNMQWHLRVMRSTLRQSREQPGLPPLDHPRLGEGETLLLVYCLGGMMDDLARRLIVYPDAELIGLLARLDASDATLADVVSLLWLKILQPGAAVPPSLADAAGAIARMLFPIE